MSRSLLALLATLSIVACQGQPARLLDDPDEILAAAAASAVTATSVHIDLTAEGTVALDPLGTGAGAPFDLQGTTAAADIDLQGGKTRATFSAPALLGLAGEVIVVDAIYLKTTLTGAQFQVIPFAEQPEAPLKGVTDLLARTDLDPAKGADAPCAGGTCYTLTIRLDAEDLAGPGGGVALPSGLPIPIPDLAGAGVDLTLLVEQTTTRLSGITANLDLGDTGELTLGGTFTRWNEPVQIVPPPADQIGLAG
jgi:hypothetical protein